MKKTSYLFFVCAILLFKPAFALEQGYDQFKNTKIYMIFHLSGKPALFLGEKYESQTGKKMKDLIGKRFKFLLEDGSVKEARIKKIEKECDTFEGYEESYQRCYFFANQNEISMKATFAFQTDLEKFDWKWLEVLKWKEVDKVNTDKVKANIKSNGGDSFSATLGMKIPSFDKVRHRYQNVGGGTANSIDDMILNKQMNQVATSDRKWEAYLTPFACVMLQNGEIFYVSTKDGYGMGEMILDRVAILNGEKIYMVRFGSFSPYYFQNPEFRKVKDIYYYRTQFVYEHNNGFLPALEYAFKPYMSEDDPANGP